MVVVPVAATLIKLKLTISGNVESFADTQKTNLKAALKTQLNCLERGGCFLELRISSAGSINVEVTLTIPETSGNATVVEMAVTELANQDRAALGRAIGVTIEGVPIVEVTTGIIVPLAVAPPPPTPPSQATHQYLLPYALVALLALTYTAIAVSIKARVHQTAGSAGIALT